MEEYAEEYLKSGMSLRHYCDISGAPYMRLYKHLKKYHPDSMSRKNNGKSLRSKESQVKSRKITASKEELEEMFFVQGMGQKEIADFFGVNKSAVCMKMKKLGIDVKSVSQSRYWTDERRENFRRMAIAGVIGVHNHKGWKYHTTSLEVFFMDECDRLNIEYKRQYPIEKYGHQYDFYVPKYNLIVEMDGEYFHNQPKQKLKDKKQTKRCIELGYEIVRITDKQVAANRKIVEEIMNGFEKSE